jgi:hypothetical protein
MTAWKRAIICILTLGVLGLLVNPSSANPIANTTFKITEGTNVWLFEISHPESAICDAYRGSGYNYNCRLNLQYRVTSENTTSGMYGNGQVFDEQNVKVGFFGSSTFMDSPSPEWKKQMLEIALPKDGNVYLGFQSNSSRVYETISSKLISLKVKSAAQEAAEQAAAQATILKKESDDLLAEQQRQKAKKLSITCLKGKQKKIVVGETPTCPSGFKNPLSVFPTFDAFSKCKLYKKDSITGGAALTDRGQTLILNVRESTYSLNMLTYSDMECAKRILKVSSFVSSQISTTRAIDGVQRAQWGKISAFWNFHPDSGLKISFNSK